MSTRKKYNREVTDRELDSLNLVSGFIKKDETVLDVGCYKGALGKYLIENKNCIVDGIEYNDEAIRHAKTIYRNVIKFNLNKANVSKEFGGKYDVIVFADILEHLVEPENTITELKKLLNKSGRIIISVPNIGYQGVLAELANGNFEYRNSGILDRTHLRFFTRKSLRKFLTDAGLTTLEVNTVKAPTADSEFSKYFHASSNLDTMLSFFPDIDVYQFVALCENKVEHNTNTINDYKVKIAKSKFRSKLYWKESDGTYNENCSLRKYSYYSNKKTTLTYEIPSSFDKYHIRFDPFEETGFCELKKVIIKTLDDKNISILEHDKILSCNDETSIISTPDNITLVCSFFSDPAIEFNLNDINSNDITNGFKIEIEISNISNNKELIALLKNSYVSLKDSRILLKDSYFKYSRIVNSISWKITSPLRKMNYYVSKFRIVIDNLFKSLRRNLFIHKWKIFYIIYKKIKLLPNGLKYDDGYNSFLENEEKKSSLETSHIVKRFESVEQPLISILLPAYNSNKDMLDKCIISVCNQTYKNWELCICDDSSSVNYMQPLLNSYVKNNNRIKYTISKDNGHISKATNQALSISTGSHIVLLDHDDLLHKDALLYIANEISNNPEVDLIYTDEDHISEQGYRKAPFFKPDWSPTLLYSQNYVGHLVCLSKYVLDKIGNLTVGLEGAQDYDLILRASRKTRSTVHIPRILYHWREHKQSTAINADSKPYAHEAGKKALQDHLSKKYPEHFSHVEDGNEIFTYKPKFCLSEDIKASIIIPIRDKIELLQNLVKSIKEKSTWTNYEIIIVDNGSIESATLSYLDELQFDNKFSVIRDNADFNWSKVNNLGATAAIGEVLIFLNNDTIVISEDWLESMISWAQLPDVAIVGPQLLYEDGTLQHAGIIVGMGGWADHVFKSELPIHKVGPFVSPTLNRNVLAITGACQVIEKFKFEKLGGFDEQFVICGSDVELCLRAHKNGYQNVYLADSVLYHLESKSRSSFVPKNDFEQSRIKYEPYRTHSIDPFFNSNLDLMKSTPSVKI